MGAHPGWRLVPLRREFGSPNTCLNQTRERRAETRDPASACPAMPCSGFGAWRAEVQSGLIACDRTRQILPFYGDLKNKYNLKIFPRSQSFSHLPVLCTR